MDKLRNIIAVVSLDNKVMQKRFEFSGDISDEEIDEKVKSWADALIHTYWIDVDEEGE